MKEATGELNMTVVTVVAIAALMVFFYAVIWPTIKTGMTLNNACNTAGQTTFSQDLGEDGKIECANGKCTYTDADNKTTTKTCSE